VKRQGRRRYGCMEEKDIDACIPGYMEIIVRVAKLKKRTNRSGYS